ncbi:large conductance mechanosensitive channel protein MscL [Amphibiibacter pelophylacis]|uniref:Large conductance mechanosensitive channel protein MscL n=1 Tax=Amphibiibacter pelophylacis TaxID=1799477 RepID=A0ACC6P420_9BURK
MSMASEFKDFIAKGNVMDLAVGVIIGAAFGKIVDSLVKDVIMPIVNFITGGQVDFSNLYVVLRGGDKVTEGMKLADAQAVANVLAYGNFVTVVINFLILAFVIFMMVKQVNRLKKEAPAAPAAPAPTPEDIVLLREIRDSLSKR